MTKRLKKSSLACFLSDNSGGATLEFGVVSILFFLLFFSVLDFARLASAVVMAEKAAQIAARTAVVRAPACAGVPERHERGPSSEAPRFGTSCKAFAGTCDSVATVTCFGDASDATANEIWQRIENLLPGGSDIGSSLEISYQFDSNLGFLGGPYTPMVTANITPPAFQFISPLGALMTALNDSGVTIPDVIGSPTFSVSMPGEDLAQGEEG